MQKLASIILILGTFIGLTAKAQDYTLQVNQYGIDEGLDGRHMGSLQRDPNGLVWVAGGQGLYRLDGYNFERVSPEHILTSCKDDQGNIWFGGGGGVFKLDYIQQKLIKQADFEFTDITKIAFNSGYFWMSDNHRLYKYRPGEPAQIIFEFSQLPQYTPSLTLELVIDSPDNILIVQASSCFFRINDSGEVLEYKKGYPDYMSFHKTADGRLWRESFGVFNYHKKGEYDSLRETNSKVYRSLEAKLNGDNWFWAEQQPEQRDWAIIFNQSDPEALWMFARSKFHLYRYDLKTERFSSFDLSNLGLVSPRPLYLDEEGIFWISSLDGLNSIKIIENPIRRIGYELSSDIELSTRVIFPTAGGKLRFSAYSGLYEIDEADQVLELNQVRVRMKKGYETIDRLGNYPYAALDEEDCIWFATDSQGLFRYDKKTETFEEFASNGWGHGYDLIRDSKGRLWMASHGVVRVNEEQELFFSNPEDVLLPGVVSFGFLREPSGLTWIVGNTGLYLVDLSKEEVVKTYEDESLKELRTLYQDNQGMLWIGTVGNGLFRLDPETDSLTNYTIASHGLSDDRIASILAENDSTLWLGSYNGLMRFETKTQNLRVFFERDGLTHSEFNHGSAYKAPDGRMYFGGVKGINAFYPQELVLPDSESKMLLSQISIYDPKTGEMNPAEIDTQEAPKISLAPGQDFFVINFALNDYADPANNTFAYRFSDLEKNWLDLGKQHALRVTTPSPGNYELQIRGRDSNGIWTKNPLVLNITVLAPWWQRPESLAILTLVLIGMIYGLVRWRTKSLESAKSRLEKVVQERTNEISTQKDQLEKQAEELKSLDATKTRFFANISHELRTPLTLIMGHTNQLLEYEKAQDHLVQKGLKTTKKNAEGLLSLIEEIMELTKLEAGRISEEKAWVPLYKPLQRIAGIYQTATVERGISFSADLSMPKSIEVQLDLPKFEKVVNNLLSNALKFTSEKGTITLTVSIDEQVLDVKVEDTGRGIHQEDLPHIFERFYQSGRKGAPIEGGTGIGLSLVQELTQLMGGKITVSSQLGKGSSFQASFLVLVRLMEEEVPFPPEELSEEATLTTESEYSRQFEKPSLLVVEDHAEMRDFICQVLNPNYQLYEAANGQEALDLLARHHIDLVISDYMMPELDGMQLLAKMKGNEATKSIPAILLTARSDMSDKLKALSIGVDEYMLKPFNPKELLIRTKNLLSLKEERQKWLSKLASEEEVTLSVEDSFMNSVRESILTHLADVNFGVIDLAESTATSQRSLTRKLKAYSGLSPLQYITEVRLQEARRLLELDADTTIAEVMRKVGFQTGGHFSRTFQKRFGQTPSEYASELSSTH